MNIIEKLREHYVPPRVVGYVEDELKRLRAENANLREERDDLRATVNMHLATIKMFHDENHQLKKQLDKPF